MSFNVVIQTGDFDVTQEIAKLRHGNTSVGAVCSFIGTVRDRNEGDQVASLELEHYPGMTEASIQKMMQEAQTRFDIFGTTVIHRVGLLMPLDQIVLVAVTSSMLPMPTWASSRPSIRLRAPSTWPRCLL